MVDSGWRYIVRTNWMLVTEGQSLAYKPEIDVIFIGKESERAKLSAHKTELFQFKQN